jgi:hypothetical protein
MIAVTVEPPSAGEDKQLVELGRAVGPHDLAIAEVEPPLRSLYC